MRRILLFAVLALSGSFAAADELPDQQVRQAEIYNSRGQGVPQGYITGRGLFAYAAILPTQFRSLLAKLGPSDRWLDIGAGEGRALLDYWASRYDVMLPGEDGRKAEAVAVSIEDRRTEEWHKAAAQLGGRIKYHFGKRLREYAPKELGTFDVITDVFGGFSYSTDLSLFMEKTLNLLDVGGSFFTVLQDVRLERLPNEPYYTGANFLTEIRTSNGREMKVCEWLKSMSCVEVTCDFKDASPPVETYHVRKICTDTSVPKLVPVHFEAGTPPERQYQVMK